MCIRDSFLPFISISNQVRTWGIETPFFAATTDFDVHQYWVDSIVAKYYVFHEESAWQLQSKGVSRGIISVTGIPVMPEFLEHDTKRKARRSLGLGTAPFTVLTLSGGFGVGRFGEIVRAIVDTFESQSRRRFNLIVVCGKNAEVKSEIAGMKVPSNVGVQIHGFVSNIHEMMSAADLVVTKSGGLTSSEALVKGLPMLIVDPIPGQELRNADLIVEQGAGWKAINPANLAYKLTVLLGNPSLLERARKAAHALARPHAAQDILTDIYRIIQPQHELRT